MNIRQQLSIGSLVLFSIAQLLCQFRALVRVQARNWLPELDARRTSQPKEIHLVVRMTIRRFKRGFIYLGEATQLKFLYTIAPSMPTDKFFHSYQPKTSAEHHTH